MKLALLGAAPSSRELAPFKDVNWEIWACSPPNWDAPRIDAWFELHSLDRKMGMPSNAPYIKVIKTHSRVYIAMKHPGFPNAIIFPRDELLVKYGRYFFTSSLAWMMALAIEQKPEMIGLWGVDMSATEEYGYQRAGMHYFIQKALDAGIQIYVPPESDLLCPVPLYGYKEHTRMWWKQKIRREELEGRLSNTLTHKERLDREELVFRGALDDINYVMNTYDPEAFDGVVGCGPWQILKPKPQEETKEVENG